MKVSPKPPFPLFPHRPAPSLQWVSPAHKGLSTCRQDTAVSSSSSPGACITMQVQDDRVTGSQCVLIPHLVLPLGSLPPDSWDSVPGNRSRGQWHNQMMMTVKGTTVKFKSQLSRGKENRWVGEANCPVTSITNYGLQAVRMASDSLCRRFPGLQRGFCWATETHTRRSNHRHGDGCFSHRNWKVREETSHLVSHQVFIWD